MMREQQKFKKKQAVSSFSSFFFVVSLKSLFQAFILYFQDLWRPQQHLVASNTLQNVELLGFARYPTCVKERKEN